MGTRPCLLQVIALQSPWSFLLQLHLPLHCTCGQSVGSTCCRSHANLKPTPSHSLALKDRDRAKREEKRDSTSILSPHSTTMTTSHSCYLSQFPSSSVHLTILQFKFRETLKISGSLNLDTGSKETITRNVVQQVLTVNCNRRKDKAVNPILIKLTENTCLYSQRHQTSRRNCKVIACQWKHLFHSKFINIWSSREHVK